MNSRSCFYGTKSKLRLVFAITKHCVYGFPMMYFVIRFQKLRQKKNQKYLVRTTHFWNNVHQERSKPKYLKPNNLKIFGSNTKNQRALTLHKLIQTLLHVIQDRQKLIQTLLHVIQDRQKLIQTLLHVIQDRQKLIKTLFHAKQDRKQLTQTLLHVIQDRKK